MSSGHIGWLLSFYGALRLKFSCEEYWLDCPLAVSARKLIVQFCSLSGTIFPSGTHTSSPSSLWLPFFFGYIIPDSCDRCGTSLIEVEDVCSS